MGNSALRPIHNQSNIIHTKFMLREKRDKSKTSRICKNRIERSRGALGSDAAIEASDVVIRDDSLEKVSEAKHLSKKTRRVRIISVLNALRMLFYRPKYLKQNKEKQTQPMLSSADQSKGWSAFFLFCIFTHQVIALEFYCFIYCFTTDQSFSRKEYQRIVLVFFLPS